MDKKTNQMNWEAIKYIYRRVLVRNCKIEYLGGDKYKIISFYPNGNKYWEEEYQNKELHGKCIGWHEDGEEWWKLQFINGLEINGLAITDPDELENKQ